LFFLNLILNKIIKKDFLLYFKEFLEKDAYIRTDILGNKVKDIHLSNVGTQDIFVGDLSTGMYFGNLVHNDKVVAVKKLIIK